MAEIMTSKELAHYLAFSEYTIEKWARKGWIPGEKRGGHWFFSKDVIDAWLDEHPATRLERVR